MVDRDEPKQQIRSPYDFTNTIISTDERYNDCFPYIQQFQPRAVTNFYKSSMELKIQSIIDPFQWDIAFLLTLEWVKVLRTSFSQRTPSLRSNCRKAKFHMGQVYPLWDSTGKRYIYNLATKERFCEKPDLSTLYETLEAMKIHESTNGVFFLLYPNLIAAWIKRVGKKLWNYSVIFPFMLTYRLWCTPLKKRSQRNVRWRRRWVLCWR